MAEFYHPAGYRLRSPDAGSELLAEGAGCLASTTRRRLKWCLLAASPRTKPRRSS